MYVQNYITIHLKVVETFNSKPQMLNLMVVLQQKVIGSLNLAGFILWGPCMN